MANPPAVEALLVGASAAGACPRVDGLRASPAVVGLRASPAVVGLRASPAVVGVLAPLGPRAPACDKLLAVVVSAYVGDRGAGVKT